MTDPIDLLTYRIEIFNSAGRSAGKSSREAYAATGSAPAPVESLKATATEHGALLEWKPFARSDASSVDLVRTDLSAVPAPKNRKESKPASLPIHHGKSSHSGKTPESPQKLAHLRTPINNPAGGNSGTIDTTATMGDTYRYTAQTVRTTNIDGHDLVLRSVPSPQVTVAMRDTFPPKPPSGLATIPGATAATDGHPAISYIDLSWEPNAEPDLAGYLVYRQLVGANGTPEGVPSKLTPSPIPTPTYRDVAVAPGQRYSYDVTAVDASANESAPSAKAQEVTGPPNVDDSPH